MLRIVRPYRWVVGMVVGFLIFKYWPKTGDGELTAVHWIGVIIFFAALASIPGGSSGGE